jgi:hypothetical protein
MSIPLFPQRSRPGWPGRSATLLREAPLLQEKPRISGLLEKRHCLCEQRRFSWEAPIAAGSASEEKRRRSAIKEKRHERSATSRRSAREGAFVERGTCYVDFPAAALPPRSAKGGASLSEKRASPSERRAYREKHQPLALIPRGPLLRERIAEGWRFSR